MRITATMGLLLVIFLVGISLAGLDGVRVQRANVGVVVLCPYGEFIDQADPMNIYLFISAGTRLTGRLTANLDGDCNYEITGETQGEGNSILFDAVMVSGSGTCYRRLQVSGTIAIGCKRIDGWAIGSGEGQGSEAGPILLKRESE